MPTDPHDAPHLARLTPWVIKANAKIASSIEDARAHAEKSLTRGVINAAEGRSTWRMLKSQGSAKASQNRLNDLLDFLAGSGVSSLDGLIQDARAKFYREAFDHWHSQPEPFKSAFDPQAKPKASGELKARGLILWGLSPRQELASVFLSASNGLKAATNAAAIPGTKDSMIDSLFDGWQDKTTKSIQKKVALELSNSQVAILNMVGRDMVKGEFKAQ
jgi:hypothetical protein